jgi:hypothetical protein
MVSDGGEGDAGSFTELRAVETELRELLTDLRAQQDTLLEQRQETWESWLVERFGETPHAQTISNAEVADEYPTTPDLKRAFSSLLGFEPEFPERCATLTSEIEHLADVRAETRHRLHRLYRDIIVDHTEDRDAVTTLSIANPAGEPELIQAQFRDETREVELSVTLGETPAADRVHGHVSPHNASESPPQPPTLSTDSQSADRGLPLSVTGVLPDGPLQFTVAGRFLDTLPVIYTLTQLPELYEAQEPIAATTGIEQSE